MSEAAGHRAHQRTSSSPSPPAAQQVASILALPSHRLDRQRAMLADRAQIGDFDVIGVAARGDVVLETAQAARRAREAGESPPNSGCAIGARFRALARRQSAVHGAVVAPVAEPRRRRAKNGPRKLSQLIVCRASTSGIRFRKGPWTDHPSRSANMW